MPATAYVIRASHASSLACSTWHPANERLTWRWVLPSPSPSPTSTRLTPRSERRLGVLIQSNIDQVWCHIVSKRILLHRKEEHEFYVDISPEFGFPLAIRPRFQLNAIIQRDPDVPILRWIGSTNLPINERPFLNCSKFPEELILPFLWAQDGFSEPSDAMAEAIRYGLAAPRKITMIGESQHSKALRSNPAS